MHCPQSTIPTSLLGFGVINLMEGCTLSSADFHYPHTFTSYTDVSLSFSLDSPEDKMEGGQFGELPDLPHFDYDPDEPLVIAANEAEVEEEEYEEEYENTEEDYTTRVSVETSVDVISSVPDLEAAASDTKVALVTKEDFMKKEEEAGGTELPGTELNISPEEAGTKTELHHSVLLKLRNKIAHGKHWLDDFTSAVREIQRST